MNTQQLVNQKNEKFQQIVALIAKELGGDRAAAECETEELVENWMKAEADDDPPQPTSELQRLLAEHHEIIEQMLDAEDQ